MQPGQSRKPVVRVSASQLGAILALLVVLILLTMPASAKVIGADDRVNIIPGDFARTEHSIGIVSSTSGHGGCTAFCVAPNVIATSAHCLLDKNGSWADENLSFFFVRYTGFPPGSGQRKSYTYLAGTNKHTRRMQVVLGTRIQRPKSRHWMRTRKDDWSLLRLRGNACKHSLSVKPIKNLSKATRKTGVGMPSILFRSKEQVKSGVPSTLFGGNCRFTKRLPGMPSRYQRGFQRGMGVALGSVHSCDAERGQSGSPLVQKMPDGKMHVVGIHSGHGSWCVTRGKWRTCYPFNLAASAVRLAGSLKRFRSETVAGEDDIKPIQQVLRKKRFYKGGIDGVFGPGTRRAIERYERSIKWAHLGIPTHELMRKMGLPVPDKPKRPKSLPGLPITKVFPGKIFTGGYNTLIGKDDRTPKLPPSIAPASAAVGSLQDRFDLCTAFCVSPTVIATNASCLVDDSGRWKSASNFFQFVRWDGHRRVATTVMGTSSRVREQNIALGRLHRRRSVQGLKLSVNDWALMRVNPGVCGARLKVETPSTTAAPAKVTGLLSAMPLSAEDKDKKKNSPVFSPECGVVKNFSGPADPIKKAALELLPKDGLVLHTCDVQTEQTGSPLVRTLPDGQVAVAGISTGHMVLRRNVSLGKSIAYTLNTAVPMSAVAPSLKRFQSEKILGYSDVSRIQRALRKLHLHNGRTGGVFDMATREAILLYEKTQKLPLLGLPTKRILDLLKPVIDKLRPLKSTPGLPISQVFPGKLFTGGYSTLIGKDDRTPKLPPSIAPASAAIGSLQDRFDFCTAFCVSPTVIATNASCLVDDSGRWKSASNFFQFVRWDGNKRIATTVKGLSSRVREQNISLGRLHRRRSVQGLKLSVNDWALMRVNPGVCGASLKVEVPSSKANPAKATGLLSAMPLNAKDKDNKKSTPVFSPECGVVKNFSGPADAVRKAALGLLPKDGLILHTCDVQTEQTGSPLVRALPDGQVAVSGISTGHMVLRRNVSLGKSAAYKLNTAVPMSAVAPSLKRFQSEKILGYSEISRIQKALRKLHLHNGRTGGVFDMATREAILLYEKTQKLPLLGLPTQRILDLLEPES